MCPSFLGCFGRWGARPPATGGAPTLGPEPSGSGPSHQDTLPGWELMEVTFHLSRMPPDHTQGLCQTAVPSS